MLNDNLGKFWWCRVTLALSVFYQDRKRKNLIMLLTLAIVELC
ncbi:hypothetical protein BN440_1229 [Erwinia amylovora MR1]|nr:hypothetical protein BN440_1229 [Erwinia amylovora MR1]